MHLCRAFEPLVKRTVRTTQTALTKQLHVLVYITVQMLKPELHSNQIPSMVQHAEKISEAASSITTKIKMNDACKLHAFHADGMVNGIHQSTTVY